MVDFAGQYYRLSEARCEPKPLRKPHPPFVIGGSGEKLTLRVVAEYASIWNFAGGPVEESTRLSEVLDGHCAAVGRNPADIQRSIQVPVEADHLDVTRDTLRGFISAGATHLILNLGSARVGPEAGDPYQASIIRRLVDEVVGPLQQELGAG